MPASSINLVVALPAEAKPIASGFDLKRVPANGGFPVYRHQNTALVVSAPGKINSAVATAYLGTVGGCVKDAIWVNIGVAGHAERGVGEVLLAHSITDGGSGRCWHPAQCPGGHCPSDSLVTLDQPDLSYRRNAMVDMEAAGFYPAACRFSPVELVQTLKVISDNRSETARGLSAKRVQRLVEGSLDTLEALIARLVECAGGLGELQS
jgi:nucleoside phosphorylase